MNQNPSAATANHPPRVDLIAGTEMAAGLLASEAQDPRAQRIFMRELATSQLSHFGWFYLLATLLELRGAKPADAAQAQAPEMTIPRGWECRSGHAGS